MDSTTAEEVDSKPESTVEESYRKLQQIRTSVEDIVAKVLSIKKEGNPKSELRELVTQMCLNFVALRQVNRSILLEEDHVKAETENAKAPVHLTTRQLQNLTYEKKHYVKAIKAFKEFKTKYPDIYLVPEEEFFRDAPDAIKNSRMSNYSAHDLMLKRLNFELFQRKELCKLHQKLEERKKILSETISNRKKFLSSLPSHLKSLKKASFPVQHQLGVQHSKKLKQHQSAELIPPPLYVIYSKLLAQKEAFGENIDLEIVGSVKDAQTLSRQQANKNIGTSMSPENYKLEDSRTEGENEEENDGQRRKKWPKMGPVECLDQTGLYETHPLKIVLHIHDDEASDSKFAEPITLKFEYVLKLNLVCVGIEGSQEDSENNILCNLFPDDIGIELPYQSAKLCFGDSPVLYERRTSRPYKWAQHLAGIDLLQEVPPLLTVCENYSNSGLSIHRQQIRVSTVLQKIRSHKKA